MRDNEVYFGFGMTPGEAEMLYRQLNARLNAGGLEDHEKEALSKFRDRVLDFTRRHPCKYGKEAL